MAPEVSKEYECKMPTGDWEKVTVIEYDDPDRPQKCYVLFGSMFIWVDLADLREIKAA